MEEKNKHYYLSLGMSFGVLGGVIFNNIAMGLIGGVVIGTLLDDMEGKKREKSEEDRP